MMSEEEVNSFDELNIDLKDVDELALGLEVCSKQSNMLIQDLVKSLFELRQENEQLKEELKNIKQPQIFIDTEDMEERYGEQLYQDYLKEQNDLYKSVIEEIKNKIEEFNLGKYDYSVPVFEIKEILNELKESE